MKKRSNLKKSSENVFYLKLILGGQSLHLPPEQLADVVATLLRRCCDVVATLLRRCCDVVATLLRRCCDVVARQARLVWRRQDPGKNRLGRFILILRRKRNIPNRRLDS